MDKSTEFDVLEKKVGFGLAVLLLYPDVKGIPFNYNAQMLAKVYDLAIDEAERAVILAKIKELLDGCGVGYCVELYDSTKDKVLRQMVLEMISKITLDFKQWTQELKTVSLDELSRGDDFYGVFYASMEANVSCHEDWMYALSELPNNRYISSKAQAAIKKVDLSFEGLASILQSAESENMQNFLFNQMLGKATKHDHWSFLHNHELRKRFGHSTGRRILTGLANTAETDDQWRPLLRENWHKVEGEKKVLAAINGMSLSFEGWMEEAGLSMIGAEVIVKMADKLGEIALSFDHWISLHRLANVSNIGFEHPAIVKAGKKMKETATTFMQKFQVLERLTPEERDAYLDDIRILTITDDELEKLASYAFPGTKVEEFILDEVGKRSLSFEYIVSLLKNTPAFDHSVLSKGMLQALGYNVNAPHRLLFKLLVELNECNQSFEKWYKVFSEAISEDELPLKQLALKKMRAMVSAE